MADLIKWPFGAPTVSAVTAGATMAVTIDDTFTVLAITAMTADGTLNLTISDNVEEGAILMVSCESIATTKTLTPGTGFSTVAAGQVFLASGEEVMGATYVFNGTAFILAGSHLADV